jgi:hypothetical protein
MTEPFTLPSNVHPLELPPVSDQTMYVSTAGSTRITRAGAIRITRAGATRITRVTIATNPHVTPFALPNSVNPVELP